MHPVRINPCMPLEPNLLTPLNRDSARHTALNVYNSLHASILDGRLKPGTVLSQVEIARQLSVSRTPVREAMRMLQEGGLLVGEPNHRSRVQGFDPQDIEALYIKRIVLETLGVFVTAKAMSRESIHELEQVVVALEDEGAHQSFDQWLKLHRQFHRLIVSGSGTTIAADLAILEMRSERYQTTYKGQHREGWWQRGEAEHREVFEAIKAGQSERAAELLARHLARTALELLAALTPEYDTASLRASLRFAMAGATVKEHASK